MAFKIVFVIAALVACAQAGGPAAYSISSPSIDHGSVGNSQEHTVKGHYGQNSQSDYSSSVTAGHAVSHVSRSSTTNDAVGYAPSYGGHVVAAAAPIAHGPVISSGPILSHGYGYAAAAPAISSGYIASAPAISHGYVASAPAISHGYTAPAYSSYYASAPSAYKVAAAPAYSAGYLSAAPAYSHGYVASAPAAYKVAAAPAAVTYASNVGYAGLAGHGLGLGLAAAHYAAPAYAPAPILKAAVAAPALVHTSVAGHGVHYAY